MLYLSNFGLKVNKKKNGAEGIFLRLSFESEIDFFRSRYSQVQMRAWNYRTWTFRALSTTGNEAPL